MFFRAAVLGCLLLTSFSAWSQRFDILVAGNYSVPQFDNYFRGGYESRLGYSLRFRDISQAKFGYGGLLEHTKFTPRIDNPVGLTQARLYSLVLQIGYNLLQSEHRLEPIAEFGYHYISYNEGDFFGQGIGLNMGGQYQHEIEPGYGIEFGMLLKNVFDQFGLHQNPSETTFQQMIQLRLGLWFGIN